MGKAPASRQRRGSTYPQLLRRRRAIGEVEIGRPALAAIGRLLAMLSDRAIGILRIGHPYQRVLARAQYAFPETGQHHLAVDQAAGEIDPAVGCIDPGLAPLAFG